MSYLCLYKNVGKCILESCICLGLLILLFTAATEHIMLHFCHLPYSNSSFDLQPCEAAVSGRALCDCFVSLTEVVG